MTDLNYDELVRAGKNFGVDDITTEEWEGNKHFKARVAVTRIMNGRQNVSQKARERRERQRDTVDGAVILGSRDIVSKGKTILDSRGVRAVVMQKDGTGTFLEEMTCWTKDDGTLLMGVPGDKVDLEVERGQSEVGDKIYNNCAIRKCVVKASGVIHDWKSLKEWSPPVLHPRDVTEDMQYKPVFVRGRVTGVDPEPIFVDGNIEDDEPVWQNKSPVCQLTVDPEDGTNFIRVRLRVTNNGKRLVDVDGLDQSAKTGNIDEIVDTMVGRNVVVAGVVTRYKAGSNNYIDIDTAMVFEEELDSSGKQTTLDQAAPAAQAPQTEEPKPPPTATTAPEPAATAPTTSTGPQGRVEKLKEKVRELYELMGEDGLMPEDLGIANLKELDLYPPGEKEALVRACIKKVLKEVKAE